MLHHTVIDTPIGPLTLVASAAGLCAVRFAAGRGPEHGSPGAIAADDPSHPVLVEAARQLGEYFAGLRQEFDLPLDVKGTPFQRAAWAALHAIPYGTTISYAEQADRIGDRRAARAVGAANGRNPVPIVVPCHRVVGADGSLTGFAGGTDVKAWLLDHERRMRAGAG